MTQRPPLLNALAERLARVPFSPFRGSGQGVRQAYDDRFTRVEFASADGTPLVGVLARRNDGVTRPAVILGHGVWASKELDALVDLADFYYGNGWDVFVVDFQGHGESAKLSKAPYTMGWKEAENYVGAVHHLRSLGVQSICLQGNSMSGAAVLLAEEQARGLVDCLVVGSPPAKQELHFIMSHIDKWLRIQKTDPVTYFNEAGSFYGVSGEETRRRDETLDAIRGLQTPTLIIQADDDDFIPTPDQALVAAAATANPNVVLIHQPRGGHGVELYLNDRYWYSAVTAAFMKATQAPDSDAVSDAVPTPLDVQLKIEMGWDDLLLATIWLRNSAPVPLTDLTVRLPLLAEPAPAYTAAPPMFGPVERDGAELRWRADLLPGNAEVIGPFTVALRATALPPGTRLRTRATAEWVGPTPGATRSNQAGYTAR